MTQPGRDTFTEFATNRWATLFRCAYLLTGSTADAEDCVQTALTKAYAVWGRIERLEQPEAYVRKMVVNTFLSDRRRRGRPQVLVVEREAAAASPEPAVAARLDLGAAVAKLPPRQRAVIVLRFYCDATERQAAEVLGCSVGTVKSQTADALKNLRRQLGDDHPLEGIAP